MKLVKHIKGTYEEGNGIILSDGIHAELIKFDKHKGEPTDENMTYINRRFEIYCEKNNLKIKTK